MARAHIKAIGKGLELGEGPHWNAERQELLYLDFMGHAFYRYEPSTGENSKLPLDDHSSIIIPVESSPNEYIVTSNRRLLKMEWDGKSREEKLSMSSLKEIATVDEHAPVNKFNDGKCDASGRLWVGTMGFGDTLDDFEREKGSLYRLGLDGQLTSHLDNISLSNGLAWSSDGQKFFYIDSLTYTIQVFDFDQTSGSLSNGKILKEYKKDGLPGLPDGMTIDTSNNLWVASHGVGRVFHIDTTTGKLIEEISFDGRATGTTSCAFGGPNLDTLYVTTGTIWLTPEQLEAQPDAGALFEVTNIGAKGISGGVNFKGNLSI